MGVDEEVGVALKAKTIAVVGVSRDESKESSMVAAYLQSKGYRVIPVNPSARQLLGEKCFSSLVDLPGALQEKVEVVLVFRPAAEISGVLRDCLSMSACGYGKRVFWTQSGIPISPSDEKRARRAGLLVVQDRCMRVEREKPA